MDDDGHEMYLKYIDEMTQFASSLVGPFTADQLASDTLEHVLAGTSWRSADDVRAYLYRSVVNRAHSERRAAGRRLRREAEYVRRVKAPANPLVRVEVLDALRRLTVRQRGVIYLTYWLDLDVESVAETLSLTKRTVERDLNRARHHLKELLR